MPTATSASPPATMSAPAPCPSCAWRPTRTASRSCRAGTRARPRSPTARGSAAGTASRRGTPRRTTPRSRTRRAGPGERRVAEQSQRQHWLPHLAPISTNASSAAAAPTSSATIGALVQPCSLPRSSASTSRNSPAERVAWPAQSMRRRAGRATPRRSVCQPDAGGPIGMLMRKIHCQSRPLVSSAATSGPTAKAPPIVAP